jgi:hypothetical protein
MFPATRSLSTQYRKRSTVLRKTPNTTAWPRRTKNEVSTNLIQKLFIRQGVRKMSISGSILYLGHIALPILVRLTRKTARQHVSFIAQKTGNRRSTIVRSASVLWLSLAHRQASTTTVAVALYPMAKPSLPFRYRRF